MGVFYNNYVKQCNIVGKSPSAVALDVGLSKATVSGWKSGRTNPTSATSQKLAEYFGISVDELIGAGSAEPTPPAPSVAPEDLALLAKYRAADETTQAAIRLLLKL